MTPGSGRPARPAQSRPAARRVAGRRAHPSPGPSAAATAAEDEIAVEAEPAPPEETAVDDPAVDDGAADDAAVADAAREEAAGEEAAGEEIAGEESGEDAGEETAATARPGRRLPRWLPIVSGVLIVVFLATTGILSWRLYEGHAREVSRNDVLRIVPSYASRIFSFDYRHLDQDAKAAHPLLVGAYRDDYDKSMKRRAPDYTKYHYIVKSSVASTGVSDASADQVRVVAFIDQTVTAGVPKSATTQEQIRLALTFERHGGSWLLAKVAAV